MERKPDAVASYVDDASLVARARAGDEAAFTVLVSRRENRLYRLAWSILRNEADALDAAQEAWIKAWRELPQLREVDRFDVWIMRSLVNRCRDMLRTRKRLLAREIPMTPDSPADHGGSVGGLGDALADADAIRRAFERLKPDDRIYIALHYAEGRSVSEISAVVGAPEGTIKWRLSRARKALDRELARQTR